MRFLCVLCALCGCAFQASALDREAFTFTSYDLDVRVEPEQQRLAVRGKLTLRNDSASAQKNLCLQISSTLDRRETGAIRHPALHLGYRPHWRTLRGNCDAAAASSSEGHNRIGDRLRRNDTARRNAADTNWRP